MSSPVALRPRFLGLDVGSRRVGVALSDPLGIARPLLTLFRSGRRDDLRSILRLVRRYECAAIVAGDPRHISGEASAQGAKVRAFLDQLRAETGVPIYLWDERLTTWEAERHPLLAGRTLREKKAMVDQVAASIILQGWLDAHATPLPGEPG